MQTITQTLTQTARTILACIEHAQHAHNELQHSQPGYPTNTSAKATPTHTQPTGLDQHLNHTDPAHTDLQTLLTLTQQLHTNAQSLHRIVVLWSNQHTDGQPKNHADDCITCTTTVTKPDRIRAGLCGACYQHWTRTRKEQPTIERHQWITMRRKALAGDMVTTTDPNHHTASIDL
jgi:hypothetical protein